MRNRIGRALRDFVVRKRFWVIWIGLFLIAVRAALPFIVKSYVNKTLNGLNGYRASVGDIDINLWRGAYVIEDVLLEKVTGNVPAPFCAASELDLSIEWSALFDGSLVGEVKFNDLKINFVQGPTEEQSQAGGKNDFVKTVKKLFPLKINRFDVNNGEIHFRNFHSEPMVDIYIDSLTVHATNFTNSRDLSTSLVASVDGKGKVMGTARLSGSVAIDPYAALPAFSLDVQLEQVELTRLNDFFDAYANIDVESGTLEVYAELAADSGKFAGYVKPLFHDMNLIDFGEDSKQPLKLLWELIVEGASKIFTNPATDQLATKIPFSGTIDSPEADILSTVGELLKNAFIKSLQPGVEGKITLESAREK